MWFAKSDCGCSMEICFHGWWERAWEECWRNIWGSSVSWEWAVGQEVFWRRGIWVGRYCCCLHSILDPNFSGNSRVAVIHQWEISYTLQMEPRIP